jgi:hypothetical protein
MSNTRTIKAHRKLLHTFSTYTTGQLCLQIWEENQKADQESSRKLGMVVQTYNPALGRWKQGGSQVQDQLHSKTLL